MQASPNGNNMAIIDAHQHFWKISRGDYSWMDETVEPIRKDFFPADLARIARPVGVTATVAVQAAPTVAETEFLLSLTSEDDLIAGVVGWLDLESEDISPDLERLTEDGHLKGIRPFLEYIADENWIISTPVMNNLAKIERAGLTLDALIRPRHFAAITRLADMLPNLRIVIDHCAKPEIQNGRDPGDGWREALREIARRPNVYCKLSGLITEVGPGWQIGDLRPVSEHAIAVFGCDRVMWGSDWPVVELAGTYADWMASTHILLGELSLAEKSAVFSQAARQFYALA